MNAIFAGKRSHRLVVQTDYGYIGAEAIDDCEFELGETVLGVERDHGTQYWRGAGRSTCEVYVEGFDAGREWAARWLNP